MKRIFILVPLLLLVVGCIGTATPLTMIQATPDVNLREVQNSPAAPVCPTCPPVISQTARVITVTPSKTKKPTKTATATRQPTKTFTATTRPSNTPFTKVYRVHEDAPVYLSNVIYLDRGCNWLGVVGQVFGKDGLPVRGLVVMVRGVKDGKAVELITLTGLAQGYKVPNAFEIKLADAVFDSVNVYSITVYDQKYKPLSDTLYFSTFSDCGKNMIMVNFKAIQ